MNLTWNLPKMSIMQLAIKIFFFKKVCAYVLIIIHPGPTHPAGKMRASEK